MWAVATLILLGVANSAAGSVAHVTTLGLPDGWLRRSVTTAIHLSIYGIIAMAGQWAMMHRRLEHAWRWIVSITCLPVVTWLIFRTSAGGRNYVAAWTLSAVLCGVAVTTIWKLLSVRCQTPPVESGTKEQESKFLSWWSFASAVAVIVCWPFWYFAILVGLVLRAPPRPVVGPELAVAAAGAVMAVIAGLIVGLCQWCVLRRRVSDAWLWMAPATLGMLFFSVPCNIDRFNFGVSFALGAVFLLISMLWFPQVHRAFRSMGIYWIVACREALLVGGILGLVLRLFWNFSGSVSFFLWPGWLVGLAVFSIFTRYRLKTTIVQSS
jgi:hypothetical protein